jgi:hypothetical protein
LFCLFFFRGIILFSEIPSPNFTIPCSHPSHPIAQLIPVVVEQRRFYTGLPASPRF